MASFTATFQFEAVDQVDAEAILGTWVVTPGATLLSLAGVIQQTWGPTEIGPSGSVGTALASATAQANAFQPPPVESGMMNGMAVTESPPPPVKGNYGPEGGQ